MRNTTLPAPLLEGFLAHQLFQLLFVQLATFQGQQSPVFLPLSHQLACNLHHGSPASYIQTLDACAVRSLS